MHPIPPLPLSPLPSSILPPSPLIREPVPRAHAPTRNSHAVSGEGAETHENTGTPEVVEVGVVMQSIVLVSSPPNLALAVRESKGGRDGCGSDSPSSHVEIS